MLRINTVNLKIKFSLLGNYSGITRNRQISYLLGDMKGVGFQVNVMLQASCLEPVLC
jgi:hypothetical protein